MPLPKRSNHTIPFTFVSPRILSYITGLADGLAHSAARTRKYLSTIITHRKQTMTAATTGTDDKMIANFEPGENFEDRVFMVSQKDLRTTNNGSMYIHMVFMDQSGQVVARIWQANQQMYNIIPEGGFISMRGRVESYKGNLQVIGEAIRPLKKDDVDLSRFLPHTRFDVETMWQRLLEILRTVENPHVLKVIKAFVTDEAIITGFKKAPAAITNHHAYIGGLLEHTVGLLELANRIFGDGKGVNSLFPGVSRDLILAGLLMHDIGKITELSYDTNFSYSTSGQLIGHITQAAIWLDRKVTAIEAESGEAFPEDIRNVLTHIIVAHHGSYEFGSPKLPSCPEAIAVHYIDNLDAKLNMALANMRDSRDEDSDWTQYVRPLEARIFKKDVMGIRGGADEKPE